MTRHKQTHPYQRGMEWIHSNVVLLGRCGGTNGCGKIYPMIARNYRKMICLSCLNKQGVLRYLSWVQEKYDMDMATPDIDDMDEAVGWAERSSYVKK